MLCVWHVSLAESAGWTTLVGFFHKCMCVVAKSLLSPHGTTRWLINAFWFPLLSLVNFMDIFTGHACRCWYFADILIISQIKPGPADWLKLQRHANNRILLDSNEKYSKWDKSHDQHVFLYHRGRSEVGYCMTKISDVLCQPANYDSYHGFVTLCFSMYDLCIICTCVDVFCM